MISILASSVPIFFSLRASIVSTILALASIKLKQKNENNKTNANGSLNFFILFFTINS